jgi:hypothetical protein
MPKLEFDCSKCRDIRNGTKGGITIPWHETTHDANDALRMQKRQSLSSETTQKRTSPECRAHLLPQPDERVEWSRGDPRFRPCTEIKIRRSNVEVLRSHKSSMKRRSHTRSENERPATDRQRKNQRGIRRRSRLTRQKRPIQFGVSSGVIGLNLELLGCVWDRDLAVEGERRVNRHGTAECLDHITNVSA